MLKIQVLGKGLIPRGLGLAPRKEPFKADLMLIQTIISTPGLKVNMIHPEDGHLVELTSKNVKRNWEKYSNYSGNNTSTVVPQTAPVSPASNNTSIIEHPKNDDVAKDVDNTVAENESKDNKPVDSNVNKSQDHTNQNYGKHQNGQKNINNNGFKPVTNDGKNK